MTNTDCGALKSGTEINANSEVVDILHDMMYQPEPPAPPTEYESISIGTWSSASDVDTFFSTHTAWNGWTGLKLGNYVTIRDGTYNTQWEIAGFNMEHSQTAADGTVYDNGYGIVMIPKTTLGGRYNYTMTWNNSNTVNGAYMSSTMHTSHLVNVANNLKNVLGDHLISRNVLLSNAINSNYRSKSYQWTTSYCTLMSIGQMNGKFASYYNKYDDGEANYKLPVFNYENFWMDYSFWSRGVWGPYTSVHRAWAANLDGYLDGASVSGSIPVRPLIYLR